MNDTHVLTGVAERDDLGRLIASANIALCGVAAPRGQSFSDVGHLLLTIRAGSVWGQPVCKRCIYEAIGMLRVLVRE